jgi:CIC family chloride channel protein
MRNYLHSQSINLLLPVIIGLVCGMEVVFIRTIVPLTFDLVMAVAGVNELFIAPVILAFLVAGAYLTGLLARRMPRISGAGLDVAIESYHSESGMLPAAFAPLKFLATLFTLGSGGSGGLIGPAAAIGQGTASYFSRWLKLSHDRSSMLALCGIAGCVSGLLHTPFGATIFALELCYLGGIIYEDLIPVLFSSISAYIMSAHIVRILPFGHLFERPHLFRTVVSDSAFPWSLNYLIHCIIAALITGLLGILFIKTSRMLQGLNRAKISMGFRPVLGAILVGLVGILLFRHHLSDVLGETSDLVERCATEGYSLSSAVVLLLGRWVTTALTIGFGGSGGFFAPTVLIGGLSGTVVARVLGINRINILVTTGIASALSAVINVPIAAVIIVVEAFGANFIVPAAIGSSIAFLLARKWVIYPHIRQIRTS